MKVSSYYNEAMGYGKIITIFTHEIEGVKHAIGMVFPYKLKSKYEVQAKKIYANELGIKYEDIKAHDLSVRKVHDDLTVDLSLDKKKVKLNEYTYYRKFLQVNEDLKKLNLRRE